jgi:hypothetical protein
MHACMYSSTTYKLTLWREETLPCPLFSLHSNTVLKVKLGTLVWTAKDMKVHPTISLLPIYICTYFSIKNVWHLHRCRNYVAVKAKR